MNPKSSHCPSPITYSPLPIVYIRKLTLSLFFLLSLVLGFTRVAPAADYTFTTIDPPGSTWSGAFGINDAGQIVGVYGDGTRGHGFLATPGKNKVLLVPGSEHKPVNKKGKCAKPSKCKPCKEKKVYAYRFMQTKKRPNIFCHDENDQVCNEDDNYECFYARKIASLVKEKLQSEGYDTRIWYNQCTFPYEITESENFSPDCIVHIHSNAGGGTGTETFYDPQSEKGKELARSVRDGIVSKINSCKRCLHNARTYMNGRWWEKSSFFFKCSTATTVVEVLFHSNPCDMKTLNSPEGQENIAEGIFEGTKVFLSQKDTLGGTQ